MTPLLQADAGVASRDEVRVAGVAGEPLEAARDATAMSLGDATCQSNRLAGEVVLAGTGHRPGERREAVDPLFGDGGVVHRTAHLRVGGRGG